MRLPFTADDPACTPALRNILEAAQPPTLTLSRPLTLPPPRGIRKVPRSVAIVGARAAERAALAFTKQLAALVVSAGGVVLSGGAIGVDCAAHEGAMAAGGMTWCVAPCGPGLVTPRAHKKLFQRIEASEGGILWTQPDGVTAALGQFHIRNRILVALADLVVVVQAGARSGSIYSATHALAIGCAVRVARPPAWGCEFAGSRSLLRRGRARALESLDEMRELLDLPPLVSSLDEADVGIELPNPQAQLSFDLSEDQANLFQKVTQSPQHVDEIAHSVGIRPGQAATLLLTLALENVVVEGPSGFFRRQQLL